MFVLPYKYYLSYYKTHNKPSYTKHILGIIAVFIFVTLGVLSASSFYLFSKEAPAQARNNYLTTITNAYNTTRSSTNDTIATFKVAGAKTALISSLAESSASANGYFAALDDQQRVINNINQARKNLSYQRAQLTGKAVPYGFEPITEDITNYLDDTTQALEAIQNQQEFALKILQIQGSDFYLPQITSDVLWQNPTVESVSAYYSQLKDQSGQVLNKISAIDPPSEFKNYYELEAEYLNLSKLVSDNVLNIVSNNVQSDNQASSIENAYQFITNVKNQKQNLFKDLESERLGFISAKNDLSKFDQIINKQKMIESELESMKPAPKSELQNYFNWLLARFI